MFVVVNEMPISTGPQKKSIVKAMIFWPVAAHAAHLPDLIHRRLDGQEEAEGDDDEDDHAERRRRLRVLREFGDVIRDHRRLVRDDVVEDVVDLRLGVGKEIAEVALQRLRERDQQRDEREQRGVGERRRARRSFDVVELARHFADEEEELDRRDAGALPAVRFAAVEQDGRIGQPRPDDLSAPA